MRRVISGTLIGLLIFLSFGGQRLLTERLISHIRISQREKISASANFEYLFVSKNDLKNPDIFFLIHKDELCFRGRMFDFRGSILKPNGTLFIGHFDEKETALFESLNLLSEKEKLPEGTLLFLYSPFTLEFLRPVQLFSEPAQKPNSKVLTGSGFLSFITVSYQDPFREKTSPPPQT